MADSFPPVTAAALAAVVSVLLTAAARALAPRLGFLDAPDGGRKRHQRPMPLLGGAAVVASILLGALLLLGGPLTLTPSLAGLLGSLVLVCGVGLWDDRRGMRPRTKIVALSLAMIPYLTVAPPVHEVALVGYVVPLGWLGIPFALFWLLACANIVNLIDGLDGLASGVGLAGAVVLVLLAGHLGDPGSLWIAALLAGALLGFLVHNWPPARIYLGDAGSLSIGYLIGALSVEMAQKRTAGFALIVPTLPLAVPVFDTAMAIVRRKLRGRSIGQADRRHLHHRLQDRGLSREQALVAILLMCGAACLAAGASVWLDSDWPAIAVCVGVFGSLIVARVFGDEETNLALRHFRAIGDALAASTRGLRLRILLIRLEADLLDDEPPAADSTESLPTLADQLGRLGVRRLHLLEDERPAATCGSCRQPAWELRITGPHRLSLDLAGDSDETPLEEVMLAARLWLRGQQPLETPATIPLPTAAALRAA